MKIFFDVHKVNTPLTKEYGYRYIHYRQKLKALIIAFLLCPTLSYAENPSVINLSAISIDESNNKSVIGDKHLKNKAYGIYQIRLPLLTDYNRANGTRLKVEQMLDPKTSQKVAEWAFNSYYPRILKAKGHKPSRIALLTCWNMGQGSFFLGKRASDYESKYLKALNNINKK